MALSPPAAKFCPCIPMAASNGAWYRILSSNVPFTIWTANCTNNVIMAKYRHIGMNKFHSSFFQKNFASSSLLDRKPERIKKQGTLKT